MIWTKCAVKDGKAQNCRRKCISKQYAVPDIYKEDVKFYDAHYDCLWTYRDIEYERYRKKAFPEEEYRSLNYVFAFCVPERNLLYFVHEVY